MANAHYHRLVDDICQLALIPSTALLYQTTQLSVKGVDFSLHHVEGSDAGKVLIHADFGLLPAQQREAILLRLLDTNFHLSGGEYPICFSHNERTGHVMFSASQPLDNVTGSGVLLLMGHLADYAQAWRQTYFLDERPYRQPASRPDARAL